MPPKSVSTRLESLAEVDCPGSDTGWAVVELNRMQQRLIIAVWFKRCIVASLTERRTEINIPVDSTRSALFDELVCMCYF